MIVWASTWVMLSWRPLELCEAMEPPIPRRRRQGAPDWLSTRTNRVWPPERTAETRKLPHARQLWKTTLDQLLGQAGKTRMMLSQLWMNMEWRQSAAARGDSITGAVPASAYWVAWWISVLTRFCSVLRARSPSWA